MTPDLGWLRHATAHVNGIDLHYVEGGQGPLMLFVHGFPEFWYTWRHQLAHFRATHRVVAPDMRGYNLSSKPARVEDYRAPNMVEDLRQLLAHLGERRCILVAHDWGGAIAWAFAIQYPELVERLVIVNAPHPYVFMRELKTNPAQQAASQYMLFFRQPDAEATVGADNFRWLWSFSYEGMLKRGYLTEADRDAYLAAWGQPGALTGGLNWYRATPLRPPAPGEDGSKLPDLDARHFMVRVPTLVLWGMKDEALKPGNIEGLAEVVPDLKIVRIEDAAHWVLEQRPERCNAEIAAWLAERPPA